VRSDAIQTWIGNLQISILGAIANNVSRILAMGIMVTTKIDGDIKDNLRIIFR
jgi:hypothetical protein